MGPEQATGPKTLQIIYGGGGGFGPNVLVGLSSSKFQEQLSSSSRGALRGRTDIASRSLFAAVSRAPNKMALLISLCSCLFIQHRM
jgi:hypothetical protein